MEPRQKLVLTWVLQILIIAALLGFVLFVFYGPTGLGNEESPSGSNKASVQAVGQVEGESHPFALFTSQSNRNSHGPAISYTKRQIKKVMEAAAKAGIQNKLFAPKTGTANDFLKEIRVFEKKHIVQLLYPHFGVMESVNPITPEPSEIGTEKTTLSTGPAKWVTFKHGGIHLYFHLNHTYIVMDSTKIHKQSQFKTIAESLVPVVKLQP